MPTRNHQWIQIAILAALAGIAALAISGTPVVAVGLVLAVTVVLFAMYPMLGWTLTVLAYPFIYLQLFLGRTINVPYVDLLALTTFLGIALRLLWRWYHHGERPFVLRPSLPALSVVEGFVIPGLLPFLAFLAAAALSLTNVDDLGVGIKFLLRPLMFFYVMFIALPMLIIDRPARLFTTFRAMLVVGVIAAAMGVWSLVLPPEPGVFLRAVPIAIAGVTPLGTNHNLIAEVLVSVLPVVALLALYSWGVVQRWYVIATVALGLVTLLTFSRNGWLTLAVEATIILVAMTRARGVSWRRIARVAGPLIAVAMFAVSVFSFTSVAQSSNTNRLRLTTIALEQFAAHPIVGAGVGTFQEAVSRDRWYLADFGHPQEAHGLVQKLLAETGILGLLTFCWLLVSIVGYVVRVYRRATTAPHWRLILLATLASAAGSIVFQLFNTSYFVSKLWLPLGIAVAAARLAEKGSTIGQGKMRV